MAITTARIDSLDDPRVEVYRNLRDSDLRGRGSLFMAESPRVIQRLLKTLHPIHSVLLGPSQFAALQGDLEQRGDISVYVAEIDVLSQIVGFHLHRGALAAVHRPLPDSLSLDAALGHLRERTRCTLVLAEGIANVDNMGALFRNAAAFGAEGMVLDSRCCDPLYRKSIRVSVGHVLTMPFAICHDWPGALKRLRDEWGVTLIAAESQAGAASSWTIPHDPRMALVFGSESSGLSRRTVDLCDGVCAIPMADGVPSLNLAVASAILLYELRRDGGDLRG